MFKFSYLSYYRKKKKKKIVFELEAWVIKRLKSHLFSH